MCTIDALCLMHNLSITLNVYRKHGNSQRVAKGKVLKQPSALSLNSVLVGRPLLLDHIQPLRFQRLLRRHIRRVHTRLQCRCRAMQGLRWRRRALDQWLLLPIDKSTITEEQLVDPMHMLSIFLITPGNNVGWEPALQSTKEMEPTSLWCLCLMGVWKEASENCSFTMR